jgi:hypothetical protein
MRKNINKLVAFAIGISVMSGSIVPAFAADNTQQTTSTATVSGQTVNGKPLLTLDDAIKAAISSSDTLAFDEKKISYQDKINDVNEELDDFNNVNGDQEDFNKDTRDVTLDQLKQKRDFDEDKLIQKTTKAYNDIVTSQMKIDKATKALEVQNKLLNDANLKNRLGLMTTIDLTSTQLQIESLQNQLKLSQNALNDAVASFKVLTGKDVSEFTLEQDINYETFKIDGSVDQYLDNTIDKYLKYSEELLKLNKDYYNDKDNYIALSSSSSTKFQISDLTMEQIQNLKDAADPSNKPTEPSDISTNLASYEQYLNDVATYNGKIGKYTGALAGRLVYLNTKLGVYQNETSLNETEKQLKDQLRTLYTNLLGVADNITTLKKNIELNNKQLSNAKLKYDLGLMTKSDYDTLVVNSKDLELQLRSAIDSYNTLKEEIQKPWIAFS